MYIPIKNTFLRCSNAGKHVVSLDHADVIHHINSIVLCVCVCVCVTAVFLCFHTEKSPNRPVSFHQCFSWVGGLLLSLFLWLYSLWKCPRSISTFFFGSRSPRTQEIDSLAHPSGHSTMVGCRRRIDAVLLPLFAEWPPNYAFNKRSKNIGCAVSKRPVQSLGEASILGFFLNRGLGFQRVGLFGVVPEMADFVRKLGSMVERCQCDIYSKIGKGTAINSSPLARALPYFQSLSLFLFTLALDVPLG